jgi:hypothetical protein
VKQWLLKAAPVGAILLAVIAYLLVPVATRAKFWSELRDTIRGHATALVSGDASDGAAIESDSAARQRATNSADVAMPASRVVKVDGLVAIHMSTQEQQQTGVAVLNLVETNYQSESLATGRVLDVQPLISLRADLNAARGEQEVAQASLAASSRSANRLRLLNKEDGNVSTRQLQEAESQAAVDSARVAAATRRLQDLRNAAVLQWGAPLVDLVLATNQTAFNALVSSEDVLVLVTLRPGETLPPATTSVFVGPTGERALARKAELVSAAVQTDPISQGETYLFRTSGNRLRVGMSMDAWIPRSGGTITGVEVPRAAVIWYANNLWVYIRQGEDLFVRHPLPNHEESRGGWFVSEGLAPGDAVVVAGAQMLFSEEFRSAIPSEDEARE